MASSALTYYDYMDDGESAGRMDSSDNGSTNRMVSQGNSNGSWTWTKSLNPKQKATIGTIALVALIGLIVGTGFIYLQHNFVDEKFSVNAINDNEDNDDVADLPIAQARRAEFPVPAPTGTPRVPPSIVPINASSYFDPNIEARALPEKAYEKHPTSLLLQLIRRPHPTIMDTACTHNPNRFKTQITIGRGTGVVGYGTRKTFSRRAAAEAALRILYGMQFDIPNNSALAAQCGI